MSTPKPTKKCFRKKKRTEDDDDDDDDDNEDEQSHQHRKLALEGVKLLQKQRERRSGIPAASGGPTTPKPIYGAEAGPASADGEKDDLVLQDTFAQETAVTVEDPNMLRYVEMELAKKRGQAVSDSQGNLSVENDLKRAIEDELFAVPEHLKVKKRNSMETSTQWTTGIAEVQLPIEFKLKNIEETEAAKKLLQEKRLAWKTKSDLSIPSSYSADYSQRSRDHEESLRREPRKMYKDGSGKEDDNGSKPGSGSNLDVNGRRLAATDELMLERFRKRERNRVMRR